MGGWLLFGLHLLLLLCVLLLHLQCLLLVLLLDLALPRSNRGRGARSLSDSATLLRSSGDSVSRSIATLPLSKRN